MKVTLFGNNTILGSAIADTLNRNARSIGRLARRVTVDAKDCWVVQSDSFANTPPDWLIRDCRMQFQDASHYSEDALTAEITTALQDSRTAWQELMRSRAYDCVDDGRTYATAGWKPVFVPMVAV